MQTSIVPFLRDPQDGSPLNLHIFAGDEAQVREGVLINEAGERWYPVRDGIPSLFIDELRSDDELFWDTHRASLEQLPCRPPAGRTAGQATPPDFERMESERKARDEQAEDYDRMLSLKVYEYIEIPAYRNALGLDLQAPLLEAGCGTGRFTGVFAEMAPAVFAVDLSRDSILRNRVRHAGKTAAPVHYIHADLTHLPLADGVFGRVAHCGVFEHIPSAELRGAFLRHARRTLLPDGVLLLSAYRYGGLTRLFGKSGEHAGGIPFFRFTEEELREEVGRCFEIYYFRPSLGIYMSMLLARPRPA